MSLDPKITNTLLFGIGGDRLCQEQRGYDSFIWNDDWVVCADDRGQFHGREIKHVAVLFRPRPVRQRYMNEPPFLPVPACVKELVDA